MSDCHGLRRAIEKVLDKHEDIKKVFYLGDRTNDIEAVRDFYSDREFFIVSGNCDWNSDYPTYGETVIEGVRIIYTHGHRYNVKYGTEELFQTAKTAGAKLALYGHTHVAREEYRDGIYLINPGALNGAREGREGYAIIDITVKGIMPSLINM